MVDRASQPAVVALKVQPSRLISRVVLICLAIEGLLLFLDYRVNYGRLTEIGAIRRFFNMTREDSLASFFSVTQAILLALTLWLIVVVVRNRAATRSRVAGWLLLAVFFSYLAADDGSMFHERMGTAFEDLFEGEGWTGSLVERFPSYAWQILFMPLFGLIGFVLLWFLWVELGNRRSKIVVVAALACLSIAVLLDFLEGLDEDHRFNIYRLIADSADWESYTRRAFERSSYDTLVHFSKTIEEFIEMLANTLLWSVFLEHLMRLAPVLQIRFVPPPSKPRRSGALVSCGRARCGRSLSPPVTAAACRRRSLSPTGTQ